MSKSVFVAIKSAAAKDINCGRNEVMLRGWWLGGFVLWVAATVVQSKCRLLLIINCNL